jgi:hypothetical protein
MRQALFYEFTQFQMPTNPSTEGADAGWGLALASRLKKESSEFIGAILPS